MLDTTFLSGYLDLPCPYDSGLSSFYDPIPGAVINEAPQWGLQKAECVLPLLRRPETLKVRREVLPSEAPRSHSPQLPHALVVGITSFFCDSLTLTFISLLLCDKMPGRSLLRMKFYLG